MSSKPKPEAHKYLELDPPKNLVFQRPFNTPKSQMLKLKNITDRTVVFKVKTTAPNNYIVIPNCGEVKANAVREIEIRRNSTNEEFPPDFRCKDKFLVQSMLISDEEIEKGNSDSKEFLMTKFQEIDKLKKTDPEEYKAILGEDRLTCDYVLPNETVPVHEAQSTEELAMSRESLATTNNVEISSSTATVPANVTSSTVAATKPTSAHEAEELAAAREKIKELKQALKGFKQDQAIQELTKGATTAARDVKATPAQAQLKRAAPNKNVIPVEIVALVALLAFLIGAFCF